MAKWRFEAITKEGRREAGTIDAANIKEVRRIMRGRGLRPKRITPPSLLEFDIGEWMVDNGYAKPFGAKELLLFTKQLSIMVNAGVPIIQSLEILFKQQKHPVLRRAVKHIATDVGEGKTIAEAMKDQKGFSKLYCNLVRAGEAGGILDSILNKLSIHLEKQDKIKAQIKSAMTYPVVVCVIGAAVVWGLMVFVVPQFVGMLKDSGQEVPAVTQFVIDVSEFLGNYSMYMVPGAILLGLIIKSYIKTPVGKVMYDNLFMNMPIFGEIVIKGNLASFSRTLATMLSSGVSLIDALDICIDTIDNEVIREDLGKVRKKVVEGKTLTEPLMRIKYFPPMVTQMVRVGEQTGQVDQMLEKVSDVFEDEVNQLIGNMTKMVEPLIIVVLGGIIATILVAMYLPIFMAAGGA